MLGACGDSPRITGQVLDAFGKPLSGASATIVNSSLSAISNERGEYNLTYTPGQFVIKISKEGYTSRLLPLNLTEKAIFPAAPLTLYPIPADKGVYVIDVYRTKITPLRIGKISSNPGPNNAMFTAMSDDPGSDPSNKLRLRLSNKRELIVINTTGVLLEPLGEFPLGVSVELKRLFPDFGKYQGYAIDVHKSSGLFSGQWEHLYNVKIPETKEVFKEENLIVSILKFPKEDEANISRVAFAQKTSNFIITDFISPKTTTYYFELDWYGNSEIN